MLNRTEIERLAHMGNSLRPDWPVPSLVTFLRTHHTHRAYRDVAVALAWVATDPATQTPARMNELGPWWTAVAHATGDTSRDAVPRRGEERCDTHGSRKQNCPGCAADAKALDDREAAARDTPRRQHVPGDAIAQIRRALAAATPTQPDPRVKD